jgi:choline dehydrogenase
VRLASPDPAAAPVISLPALDERDDVRRLAEAYERAVEVANGTAFRRRCDGPGPVLPDISGRLRQVQAGAYSIPHVVGTCAMGPVPEAGAVVDTSGRVHGITNVWVADASVMPDVPSGFTHIPTIMIAERVAAHVAASSDG